MTILALVVFGISATIAYVLGVVLVGREYDPKAKHLRSKAKAKAHAKPHAA